MVTIRYIQRDVDVISAALALAGVHGRNAMNSSPVSKKALVECASRKPVELFEAKRE